MASVPTASVAHRSGSPDLAPASYVTESGNGVSTEAACSESIREFYAENGYYVLPEALTPVEVEELRAETTAICEGERGDVDGFEPSMAGESEDDVLRRYLCVHFPHKISEIMLDYLGHSADRQCADSDYRAECEVHAVDAVYQGGGQAGPGLAPGRIFHSHTRPNADRRVDRSG